MNKWKRKNTAAAATTATAHETSCNGFPTTNGTYCTFSKEISHFQPKTIPIEIVLPCLGQAWIWLWHVRTLLLFLFSLYLVFSFSSSLSIYRLQLASICVHVRARFIFCLAFYFFDFDGCCLLPFSSVTTHHSTWTHRYNGKWIVIHPVIQ